MDHSGRLINLNLKIKSTIDHEFDECFVFDYNSYGFSPYFKKYEGIKPLKWRLCNKDQICEDILKKLIQKEPLFKEISSEFKKWLFLAIRGDFTEFLEKFDYFEDVPRVNWAMIYTTLRNLVDDKRNLLNDSDKSLLSKQDVFYLSVIQEVDRLAPNFYENFRKDMKKNDPILYKKLREYNLKKAV